MLISSDSDDDSPDKILNRLERNKRQLRGERKPTEYNSPIGTNSSDCGEDVILVSDTCNNRKPNSSNLMNNCFNDDIILVSETNSAQSTVNDLTKNYDSTDVFLSEPIDIVPTRGRGKRKKAIEDTGPVTRGKRGRGKKSTDSISPVRGRGRGRRGKSGSTVTPDTSIAPVRGRGRGRRRQVHGETSNSPISLLTPVLPRRGRQSNRTSSSIPIYSVGNTDDYPDASDHIALFKSVPDKPVIDLDISLDNEELSVKVLWRSLEVFPFQIRRLQKITKIFDFFAEREGVAKEKLLFMYNNKVLAPDDTPDSINYSFVKFIDGGVTSTGLSLPQETKTIHGFKLKFQCQGMKKPYILAVDKNEKLHVALIKCAEHLELPVAKLRFQFDGETVRGNLTPIDLDMDSGDCIDVKILNVNK